MGLDGSVVEYRGGETFRPRASFLMAIAIFMLALGAVPFFVLIVMQIYFGIYLHIAAVERPLWLLVLEAVVVLENIWIVVFFIRRLVCGFIRISSGGIEYRSTRKILRIEWQEISAVEFGRRGRNLVSIKIHRRSGGKPLRLVLGFLFGNESRGRIEMIVRERVPREFQIERKRPWWW
jgi:hypothetical protein